MNVYNIPSSCSFVDALAKGLAAQSKGDPIVLSKMTVLLPNRRACRNLREAFLRDSGGKPLLLPAIRPIGDVDEESLWLGENADVLNIPPAINPLRRQMSLARYLEKVFPDRFTPAQALATAAELGRFLDSVHTEGLTLDNLDSIVSDQYAAHWQITLGFLKDVLRVYWPKQLEDEGCIDPGLRRRLMIEAYTQQLKNNPPRDPVIGAGSTGSIPATAELLKTIAALPNGYVVLPGLDTVLDPESWTQIEEGHPQHGFAHLLLEKMDISRDDVQIWPECPKITPREHLISAIMRPASTIGAWTKNRTDLSAFDNLTLLEADNLDEEAGAIALIMRGYIEDETRTDPCVLVTPDRLLASRVALQLFRWGITVDDSAGLPLTQTPIGRWLLLLADVLHENISPVQLLSLLKSGFAAGGADWLADASPFRNFVRLLDRYALRGVRPEDGFNGIRAQVMTKKIPSDIREDLLKGLQVLEKIFAVAAKAKDTDSRLRALIQIAEDLASTPEIAGSTRLWAGDAGEAAADVMNALFEQNGVMPHLDWSGCRALLDAAMQPISIRPRYGTYPRLAILGPIEARLYQSGMTILGSLNEGTWPRVAEVDGWMSRPMRKNFGLPAPERAITLSAHDFAQGLGARHVIMTRSRNRDGAPTTPSRWLERLDAIMLAWNAPDIRTTGHEWVMRARLLDRPQMEVPAIKRPQPNPPSAVRPKRLTVTEISTLRRDPYGIYAKHILRLKPLDPIDADPDARDRGNLIHDVLKVYTQQFAGALPGDALKELLGIGKKLFAQSHDHPDIKGHWWPRFVRMAQALIPFEVRWRQHLLNAYAEVSAQMQLDDFTLEGRADRIEQREDGWAVIDYKTGAAPAASAVTSGDEPQLTLLGAMLLHGCFNKSLGIAKNPDTISALSYWDTSGRSDDLQTTTINKDGPANDLCEQAKAGLESLIHAYLTDAIPYICWPDPNIKRRDDYEYTHLARFQEWMKGDGSDEEEAA